MRNDLTHITVVMDRSGSMASCLSDAEGGLNTFIEDQKRQPGEARLTLVQFDHEYSLVHQDVPIKDVPPYKLVPRGNTTLLDAVGRAIVSTGETLAKIDEKDRPGLVVFVILTDGLENASREYTNSKVREMIEVQKRDYNWQFTFLGANAYAFAQAQNLGVAQGGAQYANANAAYQKTSGKVAMMRMMVASTDTDCAIDMDGIRSANAFSNEDLKAMNEPASS